MDVKPALQRPATVAVGQKNGVVRGREAPQAPHLGAVILEPRKDTASATLPDPWSGKMAHVNELLAARKVKDTVNEGERLLNERPPPSVKGQLASTSSCTAAISPPLCGNSAIDFTGVSVNFCFASKASAGTLSE